jgi:phage FluMu protein Com
MSNETVRCNWCYVVTTESELEVRLDVEHCPSCGNSGYLMDMGAAA